MLSTSRKLWIKAGVGLAITAGVGLSVLFASHTGLGLSLSAAPHWVERCYCRYYTSGSRRFPPLSAVCCSAQDYLYSAELPPSPSCFCPIQTKIPIHTQEPPHPYFPIIKIALVIFSRWISTYSNYFESEKMDSIFKFEAMFSIRIY